MIKKILISFLFLILFLPLVFAYNAEITINSNFNEFNTHVYQCDSSGCNDINFYDKVTNGIYFILGSGDNYYSVYDFKTCYKPYIHRIHLWGDYIGSNSYDITFNKKKDCEGNINQATLSKSEIYLGESVLINANIHSAFEYPIEVPNTIKIPLEIKEEYSTETEVSFYANDIKINEEIKEILLSSNEEFEFEWAPSTPGIYEIKIKTKVIDCACDSQTPQIKIAGILQVNSIPDCVEDIQFTDWSEWENQTNCRPDNTLEQKRTRIKYDVNNCGSFANQTEEETKTVSCIYQNPECCNDSECSEDYSTDYCFNGDVYKDSYDFFCSVQGVCESNILTELIKDCGEDYCEEWRYYCSKDELYKKRDCYEKGCSSASCFSNQNTEEEFIKSCKYGCKNGKCKSRDNDDEDEEIEEEIYIPTYISGNYSEIESTIFLKPDFEEDSKVNFNLILILIILIGIVLLLFLIIFVLKK